MMFEFEKKIPITEEEFMCLWTITAPHAAAQTQINYYYDTDNLALNRQEITCRIREKDGVFTATVKEHHAGFTDCSAEISRPAKNEFDNSLFTERPVILQGCLMTERVCLFRESGLNAVIDKNTYLDNVDYEIEIEYDPEDVDRADFIIDYCADVLSSVIHEIDYSTFHERTKLARSKSERFFKRLKKEERKTSMDNKLLEAQQQYYLAKAEMFRNAQLLDELYKSEEHSLCYNQNSPTEKEN